MNLPTSMKSWQYDSHAPRRRLRGKTCREPRMKPKPASTTHDPVISMQSPCHRKTEHLGIFEDR